MVESVAKKPWYGILYIQVLIAIALGIVIGWVWPQVGIALEPLGKGFVKLVKMIIAPVIFCTVVSGIASMTDMKKVGRVGAKATIYFEVMSTFALFMGLLVGDLIKPGSNLHINAQNLDARSASAFIEKAHSDNMVDHLMNIIPDTFLGALGSGDLLQVLLIALLTGFAIAAMGEAGRPITQGIEKLSKVFFGIIKIVVRAAPIGAFGAMGFTVGKVGPEALGSLAMLIVCFYITSIAFVLIVLGTVARVCGFSILRYLAYIKHELLIVLGTSSSETALPQMMTKLENLGCGRGVVGLVIPAGYSFNLDGTNIYMTLSTLFLAYATDTHLSIWQEVTILGVAMLTSKGASGITGAGFITLAATLQVVPDIPIASLGLLVGIDRFMSECRALTNMIGNGVATIAVSKWEGELDSARMHRVLAGE